MENKSTVVVNTELLKIMKKSEINAVTAQIGIELKILADDVIRY